MSYNLKAIRELMNEALTLEEIQDLAFDNFPQVYKQFTEGQTLSQQIRMLLYYANKHREIDKLLQEIKSINPKVSEEYQSRCRVIRLNQLSLKSNDFYNIFLAYFRGLDFSSISKETLKKAYQYSLPPYLETQDSLLPYPEIWDLEINNIAHEVLENLHQFRQLPQFIERLIQTPYIDNKFRNQLQDKLENLAQTNNQSSTDVCPNQSAKTESYILLAKLEPYQGKDEYLLSAWLVLDNDNSVPNEKSSKIISLIDSNETRPGILCNLTEAPQELNKLLEKALQYLICKSYYLITIELFLPSNLMCEKVDQWEILDIDEKVPLGTRYPIRLRSLERLHWRYLYYRRSQWCIFWDKVKNVLHESTSDLFEHLEEMDNFDREKLETKLEEEEIIGLKITRAHPESIRKDLFKAIQRATTPIAIWTREDIPNLDQATFIDQLLKDQPLRYLCQSVQKKRKKAKAQKKEHLSFHLAILWENPYRLPPGTIEELMIPGQ